MFVERLKDYLDGNGIEADDFIEANYTDCDGCVGEDYIGEDLMQAIIDKFYYPHRIAADIVAEELNERLQIADERTLLVYVQPSWGDTSIVLIILHDGTRRGSLQVY